MQVIPIEDSIVYIQPLFLQAEQTAIPELTRVIVAYSDKVEMERTLEGALLKVFGQTAPAETTSTAGPGRRLAAGRRGDRGQSLSAGSDGAASGRLGDVRGSDRRARQGPRAARRGGDDGDEVAGSGLGQGRIHVASRECAKTPPGPGRGVVLATHLLDSPE